MRRAKKIYNRWQREERTTAKGRANATAAALTARCWRQILSSLPEGSEEYIGGAYLRMTRESSVKEADYPAKFKEILIKYRRDMQYADRKAADYAMTGKTDTDNDDYAMD